MSNFTTRVEVYGAAQDDNETLHEAMLPPRSRPRFLSCLSLACLLGFFLARSFAVETVTSAPRYIYVIVPGATDGGWDWKPVDRLLSADGHTVYRPTLTGLGEKVHLSSPDINLTTHINDVVNLILYENLHEVVLVGHSYGGMVITGVMDRIPDRIRHVIFLDAAVPDNGQCALDIWGPLDPEDKVVGGLVYFPWVDTSKPLPRAEPQSLKCFTEPVSYKTPAAKLLAATYAAFIPADQSATQRAEKDTNWQRAKARGWTIRILASDHNAQWNHVKELVTLLEDAPTDRNKP